MEDLKLIRKHLRHARNAFTRNMVDLSSQAKADRYRELGDERMAQILEAHVRLELALDNALCACAEVSRANSMPRKGAVEAK